MTTKEVTITLDEHILDLVSESATRSGKTVSAWLASAARTRLQQQGAKELASWFSSDPEAQALMDLAHAASRRVIAKFDPEHAS